MVGRFDPDRMKGHGGVVQGTAKKRAGQVGLLGITTPAPAYVSGPVYPTAGIRPIRLAGAACRRRPKPTVPAAAAALGNTPPAPTPTPPTSPAATTRPVLTRPTPGTLTDRRVWTSTFGGAKPSATWHRPNRTYQPARPRPYIPGVGVVESTHPMLAGATPMVLPAWAQPDYVQAAAARKAHQATAPNPDQGAALTRVLPVVFEVPDALRAAASKALSAASTVLLIGGFSAGIVSAASHLDIAKLADTSKGAALPSGSMPGDLSVALRVGPGAVTVGDHLLIDGTLVEVTGTEPFDGGYYALTVDTGQVVAAKPGDAMFRHEHTIPAAGGLARALTPVSAAVMAAAALGAWWVSYRIAG